MTQAPTKCGFVSLIGLTNAGKSTLLNALIGAKVSIVSHKVQTTRQRILGILTEGASQILFIDAPGIFEARTGLEKTMIQTAWDTLEEGQIIMHLVDVSRPDPLKDNALIIEKLQGRGQVVLVLNKVDKIKKERLLELTQGFNGAMEYAATFMISALQEKGLPELLGYLSDHLPESEWLFPEDDISDAPMRFLAAEITREKVYDQLHKELPYATFVETEHWENFDNGDVKIMQTITIERDSQKAIVLGKGGSQIKKIGEAARLELQEMLGTKVHLKLHVKVQDGWTQKQSFLQQLLSTH